MNHYLQNIAAKNLHQIEVIQPRLASRFEPEPHHILPAYRNFQTSVRGDDGPSNVSDLYNRDHYASNHYASDNQQEVTTRNMPRSSPALEAEDLDSSGHETLIEIVSAKAPGLNSPQYRHQQPISKTIEPFSSSQSQADMPANRETVRSTSSLLGGNTPDLPSIPASSRMVSPHQTAPDIKIAQKAIRKSRPEHQPLSEEPMPFAPVEERQTAGEPNHERKAIKRRTWESRRPQKIVPLAVVREEQMSMEHKPNLKALDRPAVMSYFGTKQNEILGKLLKPETTASVQVTIGRIEIKATPEAATSQRKRAEPPVMSLEDYLKIKRGSL
jgi:hypothetical protein